MSAPVMGTAGEAVLYQLLRDGDVSPGRLEELVLDIEECRRGSIRYPGCGPLGFSMSNPHLARYAREIIARLEALSSTDP